MKRKEGGGGTLDRDCGGKLLGNSSLLTNNKKHIHERFRGGVQYQNKQQTQWSLIWACCAAHSSPLMVWVSLIFCLPVSWKHSLIPKCFTECFLNIFSNRNFQQISPWSPTTSDRHSLFMKNASLFFYCRPHKHLHTNSTTPFFMGAAHEAERRQSRVGRSSLEPMVLVRAYQAPHTAYVNG